MATYVLIHGGDQTGHIWDKVTTILENQGHQIFCPTMTSVKNTTLQHNIDEVCAVIQENHLTNIIMVAHSYGAMVGTGVFDKLFDQIDFIVYIDSAIPQNGKSLFGILEEYGFDYRNFGLTGDEPCLTPLYFDEARLQSTPKAYIHCLQSEFKEATKLVCQKILEDTQDNWLYFDLNTIHSCMLKMPKELAVILAGLPILLR